MADFHIGRQSAESIQNAETIVNIGGRPRAAQDVHRRHVVSALAFREYGRASHHVREWLEDHPEDATAHYYFVLVALRGLHPDRYATQQIHGLLRRLVTTAKADWLCYHAQVLALVINEGLLARRQPNPLRLAPQNKRLVSLIAPAHGREILVHVPAFDSPVWEDINRRLGSAER